MIIACPRSRGWAMPNDFTSSDYHLLKNWVNYIIIFEVYGSFINLKSFNQNHENFKLF
jgi:hypothetical protein